MLAVTFQHFMVRSSRRITILRRTVERPLLWNRILESTESYAMYFARAYRPRLRTLTHTVKRAGTSAGLLDAQNARSKQYRFTYITYN